MPAIRVESWGRGGVTVLCSDGLRGFDAGTLSGSKTLLVPLRQGSMIRQGPGHRYGIMIAEDSRRIIIDANR